MSLIFTSNTQDTYNQENGQSTNFGIEQPADYHNHLTSPLEIKPNSQVAVQSVRFTRKQQFDFTDGKDLLYYFGEPLEESKALTDVTSRPELVELSSGTYTPLELASELQTKMRALNVAPAVHKNFSVSTSFAGGDFKGFEISCSQRGASFTKIASAAIDGSIADRVLPSNNPPVPESGSFTLTNGVFSRTGASGTLIDGLCCGIATDFPLANGSNASMVVSFAGASYTFTDEEGASFGVNSSWAIGLTRPTTQLKNEGDDRGDAPQGFSVFGGGSSTDPAPPHFFDYVAVFNAENGSRGGSPAAAAKGAKAAAAAAATGDLKIYQAAYLVDSDGDPVPDSYKLHEIVYYGGSGQIASAITNASILSGTTATDYNAIEFKYHGDEIRVSLINASNARLQLIGSNLNNETSRVLKPTTQYTSALYPKLITSQTPGTLTITGLDSYSNASTDYKYPTYTDYFVTDMSGGTYTVGDSSYANAVSHSSQMSDDGVEGNATVVGQKPSWARRGSSFIKPPDTTYGQMLPETVSAANVTVFQGIGDTTKGVNFKHVLVLEDTSNNNPSNENGNYFSEMCNMADVLGFPDVTLLQEKDGVLSLDDKQITWTSAQDVSLNPSSAFVRVPNLNSRTYNAIKNSVSKILYHVPRFTNDGRQFGDLFFEVGERTYVDLGNTNSFTLNQFIVQIVDKNEKIVGDLVGETIVVLHIRQKEEAGKYE